MLYLLEETYIFWTSSAYEICLFPTIYLSTIYPSTIYHLSIFFNRIDSQVFLNVPFQFTGMTCKLE